MPIISTRFIRFVNLSHSLPYTIYNTQCISHNSEYFRPTTPTWKLSLFFSHTLRYVLRYMQSPDKTDSWCQIVCVGPYCLRQTFVRCQLVWYCRARPPLLQSEFPSQLRHRQWYRHIAIATGFRVMPQWAICKCLCEITKRCCLIKATWPICCMPYSSWWCHYKGL